MKSSLRFSKRVSHVAFSHLAFGHALEVVVVSKTTAVYELKAGSLGRTVEPPANSPGKVKIWQNGI
jgi:hypothetical protein